MNIKIINPIEFSGWNEQISGLPGSTVFHSSNWAQVLFESYGYQPKYFCDLHHGRLQNVFPVMEINSPLTGKRGVSLPFSDKVDPLVDGSETFEKMFSAITDFAGSSGWQSVSFRGGNEFFNSDQACESHINSYIELDGSPQSLFQSFKSNTRRNIKKAEKSTLTTRIETTKDSVTAFYRLNCLSRKDHGLPPQPFRFFKRIFENLIAAGKGFVCLSFYQDQPVSGVFFLYFNRTASYKYGASDKRFLHLRPNNLAMWHAIQKCSEGKFEVLDLGRSEMDHHGLLQYKRGWNSKETIINYYKYDVKEKKFAVKKPGLNSSYFLFKHLPIPLLKAIGNAVYKHIG